ncbi:MAG: extracellular solute-binding protein [Anaerolineae bacterium]
MSEKGRGFIRLAWAGAVCSVLALTLIGLGACTPSWPLGRTPAPTATSTPMETAVPTSPPASPTPAGTTVMTLTIWTTPYFAPGEATEGARLLAAQSKAFQESYPDIRLDWVIKPAVGPGRLRDFLLSAREVAPAVLPDLAIVDARDLDVLQSANLLQPMPDLLSEDVLNDLFPFARNLAVRFGQPYALPIAADIEHAVYDKRRLDAPPLTWTDVLSDEISYAFPAGGEDGQVNDTFLLQYFALGGRLRDEQDNLAVDEGVLAQVFSFYASGAIAGIFPPSMLEAHTPDDAVPLCLNGSAQLCNVRSQTYLKNRGEWKDLSFATIPTWNGAIATIARSQTIVLVASDPARHEAVRRFLDWFSAPERNAPWTRAAGHLPSRVSSLDLWGAQDDYGAFVRWQLSSAFTAPADADSVRLYQAIQQAVREVWEQGISPQDAARRVMSAIAPQQE